MPELHTSATLTFEPDEVRKGNYRAVTIDCNGHHERFLRKPDNTIFRIPLPTAEFADSGVPSSVRGLTVAPSRLFLTSPAPRTLLFFLSEPGASDAAPLYVLGFHPDGTPYRVLVMDQFDPYSVESTPAVTRIIGKATMSQAVCCDNGTTARNAPSSTTYDPYSVSLVEGDGPAVLSAAQSETYNRRHYVWAGPHSREDYTVLYNIPGHPKLFGLPAAQADVIMEKISKAGQKRP